MGIDLVTLSLIASVGGSALGGIQQSKAASAQASATNAEAARQAALQQQEADLSARAETRENIKLEKRQKLAFLKSGVSLEGSPLLLLDETRQKGGENVDAILRSGQTAATGTLARGGLRSAELKSSGRQALTSGLTSGAGTLAGSGIFSKKAP